MGKNWNCPMDDGQTYLLLGILAIARAFGICYNWMFERSIFVTNRRHMFYTPAASLLSWCTLRRVSAYKNVMNVTQTYRNIFIEWNADASNGFILYIFVVKVFRLKIQFPIEIYFNYNSIQIKGNWCLCFFWYFILVFFV